MDDARAILIEHARRKLIREFGATDFETWLGKDGALRHSFTQAAEYVIDSLWSVLERPEVLTTVVELHASGVLAPTIRLSEGEW